MVALTQVVQVVTTGGGDQGRKEVRCLVLDRLTGVQRRGLSCRYN